MGIVSKLLSFVGSFKNIKTLIFIGVAIVIFGVGYWHYNNYMYLKRANKTLQKNLKAKEEARQTAVSIANNNADIIQKMKVEHKKDMELLQKSYKYNTKLKRDRDELKKSIMAYKDNKLSADDMDFIKKLYPEENK